MSNTETIAKFPKKLDFLFKPRRYKGARGGRGSGKSWGFARALLIKGAGEKIRILCAREVQKSIKDSVHKLLCDQVEALGLGQFYECLETTIRGKNGTEIVYTGLASQTVESIKSFEGVDICWVEEAQVVGKRSWDLLTPTIRKEGSEIWITFNPELETDETYQRFVVNPPPDCLVAEMNYNDNPWFPATLEAERLHCKEANPKDYPNIWEGKCKPAVTGAIYFDEIQDAEANGQIRNVPYDSRLKAHVVFDMGWNDAMTVSIVQRSATEIMVPYYFEESHKKLEWWSNLLRDMKLNWGKVWMPHDAKHEDYKTGKSAQSFMETWGWEVEIVDNIGVELGLKLVRQTFPRIYFDKEKSARLVECVKRYRRHINQVTGEPGAPVHDEFSHGADNLRYICVSADKMTNGSSGKPYTPNRQKRHIVSGGVRRGR